MNIIQAFHKALSGEGIKDILCSDCKIIKYSELSEYSTVQDLLPKLLDYVVILYEDTINSGHWVGLLRYENLYEFVILMG